MLTYLVVDATAILPHLVSQTAQSHQPIVIKGNQTNAVLLSEQDWNAIHETLYLLSVPGMRESIIEGMGTDFVDCDKESPW
jgi:PHD/YefM family antitoxin component YafN of YafNO toxin-antitoxin module